MGAVLFARGPGEQVHRCCPGVPRSLLIMALRATAEVVWDYAQGSPGPGMSRQICQDLSLFICKPATVIPTSPKVEEIE